MSKTKKKTRLKGTETRRPCFDCGKTKDRFKDFKPRWAGCPAHKTEKGRRYFQEGCDDCAALVNGNIRQPRCIECDKVRPKKRKKKKAAAQAEIKPTPETAASVDPSPPAPAEPFAQSEPKVENLVSPPEDGSDAEAAASDAPDSEAVTVEPQAEPSDKSEDVTPEAAPAPSKPKIASMSDLTELFGGL